MTLNTINRCVCGNPFPHGFSESWQKIEREGRTYARCKKDGCGQELEAFPHDGGRFWVWPMGPDTERS
jgi:hypothetical protein